MPIRIFADGERPTAGDFNRYFLQQQVSLKTANESVVSSTVAQDDNHLFSTVVANTDYWVWAMIFYTGPGTGVGGADLLMDFDGPTGATFDWVSDCVGSAATSTVSTVSRNLQGIGNTPSAGCVSGVDATALIKGVLRVGANAGTFKFTWAQSNSSATAVTVYADSCMILRRLTS